MKKIKIKKNKYARDFLQLFLVIDLSFFPVLGPNISFGTVPKNLTKSKSGYFLLNSHKEVECGLTP